MYVGFSLKIVNVVFTQLIAYFYSLYYLYVGNQIKFAKKNFFNHADNPSINQSKYLCYRKNQTHIEFKTRGCWEIIQEKKMTCNECFPITVKIDDDVITSSNDTFCYRDDPQIINVSRNTTIMRYF